jgi:hypothetical protein
VTHPYYPSGNPRFNHVAMSVPADLLDERATGATSAASGRGLRVRRDGGHDRRPQAPHPVLRPLGPVHLPHRRGRPMKCPRMDHFGLAVGSLEELQGVRPGQGLPGARRPGRSHRSPHGRPGRRQDPLPLREVPAADDVRTAVVGVRLVSGARGGRPGAAVRGVRPQGWKLEYTGWSGARRLGPFGRAGPVGRIARLRPPLGLRPRGDRAPARADPRASRPTPCWRHSPSAPPRVGLGQLVTCASYRNAGLLAKEAACIDVYSGGRLILGLGAGWFHEEYHAYGYEYLSDRERLGVSSTRPSRSSSGCGRRRPSPSRASTSTSTGPTATPSRSSSSRRCWWAGAASR